MISILNYLANTTRPDIIIVVYQCARFCKNPRLSYEKAVKRIVKYLIETRHVAIQATIDINLGLVAYADSDFANGWNKLNLDDTSSLFSRIGYIIFFMGIPIVWYSKLQLRIILSLIEAEYVALSTCLRDVILIMSLIAEISKCIGNL